MEKFAYDISNIVFNKNTNIIEEILSKPINTVITLMHMCEK